MNGPNISVSPNQAPGLSATWTDPTGTSLSKPDGTSVAVSGSTPQSTTYTYDGSNRVATYTTGGVTYTCAYYTSGNGIGQIQTIVGGGYTRTFTYNSSALLTAETVTQP